MRKLKVTIEETVSETFELEVPDNELDVCGYISNLYKQGEIVLEPGEIQETQYMIEFENGEQTCWVKI